MNYVYNSEIPPDRSQEKLCGMEKPEKTAPEKLTIPCSIVRLH